jgi:hypothetical protein
MNLTPQQAMRAAVAVPGVPDEGEAVGIARLGVLHSERSFRAGFTLAAHRCAACHIYSPRQELKPLYPDVPKFEDIANRPSTSRQSLIKFLASEHGYKYSSSRPPTLRALRPLTDREKSDVALYILSFRN